MALGTAARPLKLLAFVLGVAAPVLLFGVTACGGAQSTPQQIPDPLEGVDAEVLFERGVRLAHAGDMVRAEQYLSEALEGGYPETEVVPYLIRVCVASSRMNSALGHAEPYLQAHPEDWSLRYLVATIHLGLGNVARARNELEHVISQAPDEANPYFSLGVVHRDELEDREQARAYFQRYVELAPEGAHASEANALLNPPVPVQVPPASPTSAEPPAGPTRLEPAAEPEGAGPTPAPAPAPGPSAAGETP